MVSTPGATGEGFDSPALDTGTTQEFEFWAAVTVITAAPSDRQCYPKLVVILESDSRQQCQPAANIAMGGSVAISSQGPVGMITIVVARWRGMRRRPSAGMPRDSRMGIKINTLDPARNFLETQVPKIRFNVLETPFDISEAVDISEGGGERNRTDSCQTTSTD